MELSTLSKATELPMELSTVSKATCTMYEGQENTVEYGSTAKHPSALVEMVSVCSRDLRKEQLLNTRLESALRHEEAFLSFLDSNKEEGCPPQTSRRRGSPPGAGLSIFPRLQPSPLNIDIVVKHGDYDDIYDYFNDLFNKGTILLSTRLGDGSAARQEEVYSRMHDWQLAHICGRRPAPAAPRPIAGATGEYTEGLSVAA